MPQIITVENFGSVVKTALQFSRKFSAVFKAAKLFVATIFLTCFAFFSEMAAAGFEDRTFERERLQIADEIGEILVNKGVCKGRRINCGGEIYFVGPMIGGIEITTYGILDMAIIREIVSKVMILFEHNERIKIEMYCYEIAKQESVSRFLNSKPAFLKLELKRSK